MKKLFSYTSLAAALVVGSAAAASAGELSLTISNGRVTLVAQDVTIRQILAEWARVGQTKFVNGDKLIGAPLTIELRDVPEAKALETVLRSAAGYVIAPRMAGALGPSGFDSVVILATSRAPAASVAAAPPFSPVRPQPVMPQVDDEAEPTEPGPAQTPMPGPVGQQFPGPAQNPNQPAVNMPQGPLTAPRPGQLPQTPGMTNPYQPNQPVPNQPQTRPGAPTTPGAPRPGGGSGPGGGER